MASDPRTGRDDAAATDLPLTRRFPDLARVPRVRLGTFPTPVHAIESVAPGLWTKREDVSAEPLGGNKIRSLEFLLGGVRAGDRVTTIGAAGSTHVLATAIYTRILGAQPLVYRWRQQMNPTARAVAARISRDVSQSPVSRSVAAAYVRALLARWRGAHWVPAGGSAALGVLGQVNAGVELAEQVRSGEMPPPRRIVVPLGTGGTTAGIALGAAIGGLDTEVVAVRVVPAVVANRRRVLRLVSRTARLIDRLTGDKTPAAAPIRIVPEYYGGAYGRPTARGEAAAERCQASTGIAIDATYAAKALAAAIDIAEREGGATLFWLSFDGRWLPTADRVAIR